MGTFGCFEVTIGLNQKVIERVDYMTYDTKGIFKMYEIKSSREDFYSPAKWSFVGHFNYFVMPAELYEQVKHDIPAHVGVHDGYKSMKRAKRQELSVSEDMLKDSMIRSLSREFQKQYASGNPSSIEALERSNRRLTTERNRYRKDYQTLKNKVYKKFGLGWDEE